MGCAKKVKIVKKWKSQNVKKVKIAKKNQKSQCAKKVKIVKKWKSQTVKKVRIARKWRAKSQIWMVKNPIWKKCPMYSAMMENGVNANPSQLTWAKFIVLAKN